MDRRGNNKEAASCRARSLAILDLAPCFDYFPQGRPRHSRPVPCAAAAQQQGQGLAYRSSRGSQSQLRGSLTTTQKHNSAYWLGYTVSCRQAPNCRLALSVLTVHAATEDKHVAYDLQTIGEAFRGMHHAWEDRTSSNISLQVRTWPNSARDG